MSNEDGWPERITCEWSGCSRVIKTSSDQFGLVSVTSNVLASKGSSKSEPVNVSYVLCSSCVKKITSSRFKRRNKEVDLG